MTSQKSQKSRTNNAPITTVSAWSEVLTVQVGEIAPVDEGRVERRDGGEVEEEVGVVGRVPDGIREEVHLEQGFDQVAQHLHTQLLGSGATFSAL